MYAISVNINQALIYLEYDGEYLPMYMRGVMSNKYLCLVKATDGSGLLLPPIEPGTEVTSESSDLSNAVGISADFRYLGRDKKLYQLRANEVLSAEEGRYKIFGFGQGLKTITRHSATIAAKVDTSSGAETTYPSGVPTPVKAGSISDTVDKIFRCLDPLLSS